jgi:hypothetical protein
MMQPVSGFRATAPITHGGVASSARSPPSRAAASERCASTTRAQPWQPTSPRSPPASPTRSPTPSATCPEQSRMTTIRLSRCSTTPTFSRPCTKRPASCPCSWPAKRPTPSHCCYRPRCALRAWFWPVPPLRRCHHSLILVHRRLSIFASLHEGRMYLPLSSYSPPTHQSPGSPCCQMSSCRPVADGSS